MSAVILSLGIVVLLFVLVALVRRSKKDSPSGGNAVNTDSELESLYSLLGDNSGRRKR